MQLLDPKNQAKYINGYQKLKEENKLEFIATIKNSLVNQLNYRSFPYSDTYKQFLANRVLGIDFNKEIQKAYLDKKKEIKHPLPKFWREELESFSFKAKTLSNKLRWNVFLIKWFLFGIYTILNEIKRYFTNSYKIIDNDEYVFFVNLSNHNLPRNNPNYTNNNVVHYYLTNKTSKIFTTIGHDVSNSKSYQFKNAGIVALDSPIPNISSLKNLFRFLFKASIHGFKSIFYFALQQDAQIILFREKVLSDVFSIEYKKRAKQYFFHNSTHLQRPLWTYMAEKLDSEIIFYFYSLNNYPVITYDKSNFIRTNHWNLVTWPFMWTWNQESKDDLSQLIKYPTKVKVVEPIWFSSKNKYDFKGYDKNKSIALFDIPVFKDSHYCSLGNTVDYYGFETSKIFLTDVISIANNLDYHVFFKQKRNSSLTDERYLKLISDLKVNFKNFIEISSETDAHHIIENVSKVISMPFTSTSIIAKSKGIRTAYYDATNTLIPNQKASYNIKVISSKEKLKKWIKKQTS